MYLSGEKKELKKNGRIKNNMLEVGKTFMYLGNEYKIITIDEKRNRVNIERIGDNIHIPKINEYLDIENKIYKVIYFNEGKNRITIVPIRMY
jgi:hypothetical protein